MRRFGIVFVALALVLAGFGAIGSAPSVVAQEASPEAMAAAAPRRSHPNGRAGGDPGREAICVGVIEGEYFVRPELTTFQVGQTYIFAIGNEGQEVHEFVIEPAGSEEEARSRRRRGGARREGEENGEEREAESRTSPLDRPRNWSGRLPSRATSSLPATCWTTTNEGMVIEIEVVE